MIFELRCGEKTRENLSDPEFSDGGVKAVVSPLTFAGARSLPAPGSRREPHTPPAPPTLPHIPHRQHSHVVGLWRRALKFLHLTHHALHNLIHRGADHF